LTSEVVARDAAIKPPPARSQGRSSRVAGLVVRMLGPLALALVAGGALLAALGRNPFSFYLNVYRGGIELSAWQDSVMRMAPLLLIAAGLIVAFRANIWNIGIDGQFLLAAVVVAGVAPGLERRLPNTLTLILLFALGAGVGAFWTLIPALLKARYQVNEIITTLMMSFIAISLSQILIAGPFLDRSIIQSPQTRSLPLDAMLPSIPGTRIHVGILVAAIAIFVVWFCMARTSFGLRLRILGVNPRAAKHLGLHVARLTIVTFLLSGALVGLAAATEILGVWGYVRQDWNPAFGFEVVPLVFLARLNALAVVPFVAFFAVLSIGGEYATQQAQLPYDFILLLVGLILLFMAVTEYLGRKSELGEVSFTSSLSAAMRRRADDD
jgi:general nucleoside transport system permease protein